MKKIICLIVPALLLAFAVNSADNPKKHIGIATYSVKGLESDIEGAFKSLSEAGYVTMEISNYNAGNGTIAGYKPADYAALAEKYGLKIISSHARAKFDVKDEPGTIASWGKVFDDHKLIGCKYVVFPMNMWAGSFEVLKQECDLMNKIGEEANKRGIKFGYHNHHMEFATIAGTDQMYEDYLIANTDPAKVFFQMDVYWVTQGGQDPVAYLKKYPDRFKVLHIKDDYVIGESGKIDYKAIFNQFYKNGNEDWFVELEAKMTPEQIQQNVARMEQRKIEQGQPEQPAAPQVSAPAPAQDPAANQQPAAAARPTVTPEQRALQTAETLKISLEGIKESADYLLNSSFVK